MHIIFLLQPLNHVTINFLWGTKTCRSILTNLHDALEKISFSKTSPKMIPIFEIDSLIEKITSDDRKMNISNLSIALHHGIFSYCRNLPGARGTFCCYGGGGSDKSTLGGYALVTIAFSHRMYRIGALYFRN